MNEVSHSMNFLKQMIMYQIKPLKHVLSYLTNYHILKNMNLILRKLKKKSFIFN